MRARSSVYGMETAEQRRIREREGVKVRLHFPDAAGETQRAVNISAALRTKLEYIERVGLKAFLQDTVPVDVAHVLPDAASVQEALERLRGSVPR